MSTPTSDVVEQLVHNVIKSVWAQHDSDQNGTLDKAEIKQYIDSFNASRGQAVFNEAEMDKWMTQFDTDCDGKFNYEEFSQIMLPELTAYFTANWEGVKMMMG